MLHDVLSRRWLQVVSRARLKLTHLIMMHKRSVFAELSLIKRSDPFRNTVPSVEYNVCPMFREHAPRTCSRNFLIWWCWMFYDIILSLKLHLKIHRNFPDSKYCPFFWWNSIISIVILVVFLCLSIDKSSFILPHLLRDRAHWEVIMYAQDPTARQFQTESSGIW